MIRHGCPALFNNRRAFHGALLVKTKNSAGAIGRSRPAVSKAVQSGMTEYDLPSHGVCAEGRFETSYAFPHLLQGPRSLYS